MELMTLTEFLLSRIAEDEARADDAWKAVDNGAIVWDRIHPDVRAALWPPARVLAECEAKRRIVESARRLGTRGGVTPEELLGNLALPYADHPDYDEAWRV
ncbi:DUF6221 family protein [Cellulosimicrobium sp. ES-005]|uniref:DUF6221 family protein n=1 Tax=Cellulosimicrobium sp. ES-005 TaxID=3163031 RepID=A0AAU8FXH2_9MICO